MEVGPVGPVGPVDPEINDQSIRFFMLGIMVLTGQPEHRVEELPAPDPGYPELEVWCGED